MKSVQRLILMALFLAIGTAIYAFIPGIFFGMKSDFILATMFLSLFLFADKRNIVVLGLVTGVLSGLLTTFPSGFFPNVIDKLITSAIIFLLFIALGKVKYHVISAAILTALGTMISGTVFLTSAMIIAQLPGGATFGFLFATVVLPTALTNTIFIVIFYPIVKRILKGTRLGTNHPALTKESY